MKNPFQKCNINGVQVALASMKMFLQKLCRMLKGKKHQRNGFIPTYLSVDGTGTIDIFCLSTASKFAITLHLVPCPEYYDDGIIQA